MSEKAYVIAIHDMKALLKFAEWIEKSTSDISSFRGIYSTSKNGGFHSDEIVILISADRSDLRDSIEVEFRLGDWNASFYLLEDFDQFFKSSNEIVNTNFVSENEFMIEIFSKYFSKC